MKIHIDRSICTGHALCAAKAPAVYRLDEEGFCCSDGQSVPPALHEQARLGARHCPEAAIFLEEEDSKQA
jgi:ferredoxin